MKEEEEATDELECEKPEESEGGWGWIVSIALTVNFACCYSHINSFGMQYNKFFEELNEGTGSVTLVFAISSTFMSITGILTHAALKWFTIQQVAIFAASLYTSGWFLTFFMTKLYQMIFIIGVMEAIGMSMITVVTFTSFNSYFNTRRVMVLSICQMVVGTMTMLYPVLLKYLLDEYGFRGSLLINTAIISHTLVAALCTHPVEWHRTKNNVVSSSAEKVKMLKRGDESIKDGPGKIVRSRDPSPRPIELPKEKKIGIWRKIFNVLDLSLLNDIVYLNITIGIALAQTTDNGFFLMFPLYLFSIGLSEGQVTMCLFLVSAADLLSRAFLAIFSKFFKVPSRDICFIAIVGGIASKALFLHCSSYWSFIMMTFIMGLWRGPFQLTVPLIYAEYLPEKFSAAYGLSILFMGNANTLILPAIGYLRDFTQSYIVSFYAFIALTSCCILPWAYEYWYFSRKNYNKKRKR